VTLGHERDHPESDDDGERPTALSDVRFHMILLLVRWVIGVAQVA
jgi:hypothetical protein